MQGTAGFPHQIAATRLPQAEPVCDDATALDTAVAMLDPPPPLVEALVSQLLLPGAFLATGFLGRQENLHLGECARQEAEILQQLAPCGHGRGRGVSYGLLMDTAAGGVTEQEDRERRIDQQDIFHRVVFFLVLSQVLVSGRIGVSYPRSVG